MNNRSGDSLVDITLEFLEAVIHEILFTRELYRQDIFERRRLYGLAVHRSRHPDLNSYIEDALHGLRDPIAASTLRKLTLIVLSPPPNQTTILERFILEPRLLMLTDSTSLIATTDNDADQARIRLQELESHLRAFFLKLQYVHASLLPLPPGCSFEIVAYMATRSGPGCLPSSQHWAEEDTTTPSNNNNNTMGHPIEFCSDDNAHIIPIKSCTVPGLLQVQLYVEQPTRR